MAGIITVDVFNSLVYRIHHFNGKYVIQIFRSPVFLCGGNSSRHQGKSLLVRTHLHVLFFQALCQHGEELILHGVMYQKRFAGVAHAYSLSFCIYNNIRSHGKVGGLVHIDMAVACACFDHRNGALAYDRMDQSRAASGDQNVHILIQLHKLRCRLSGCIADQLDRVFCHAVFFQCFADTVHNGLVGINGIASAFEDHGVAGLKAEAESVRRNIGAGFVNNADHSQRNSLLSDKQAVGAFLHTQHFADGILQIHKLP